MYEKERLLHEGQRAVLIMSDPPPPPLWVPILWALHILLTTISVSMPKFAPPPCLLVFVLKSLMNTTPVAKDAVSEFRSLHLYFNTFETFSRDSGFVDTLMVQQSVSSATFD